MKNALRIRSAISILLMLAMLLSIIPFAAFDNKVSDLPASFLLPIHLTRDIISINILRFQISLYLSSTWVNYNYLEAFCNGI